VKQLGLAAMALIMMAAPASAQHHGGGGGSHGGGYHGGGFRGGYGGGFRGGYGGPRVGFGFGYGCWGCAPYYPDWYGPMYSPYYYGAPYPYPPSDDDYDYGAPPPPPPPPPPSSQGYSAPSDNGWRVTRRNGETDFELPDNVLFGLDSAHISRNAETVLQEIADAARDRPGARLIVEGHTDTSGTHEHNQALSDARARAVAEVLIGEGVGRERIRGEGFGERGLAVQTGEGVREARNRRVVVRLIDGNPAQRRPEGAN
jgi:outer membrane protein OmpA-like peptidoglycan-associated protein